MNNAIVNPLLDSCLTQLTAIRTVLGERSEVYAVDAAKAQLMAVKQMLSDDDIPLLPQARPEQTRLGLNDGDYVEESDVQQVIKLKNPDFLVDDMTGKNIGKIMMKTIKHEGRPLPSKFLFEEIYKNWRKYGLPVKPTGYQVKKILRHMHNSGLIKKTGDRSSTLYSLPK